MNIGLSLRLGFTNAVRVMVPTWGLISAVCFWALGCATKVWPLTFGCISIV
jgi:hypothetical protein